jgi:uncharacterized membrane protein
MMTSVTKGGALKLPKRFKIVATYWHDHSLESSWDALSDGAISFSFHQFPEEKCIFWIFLKNTSFLKELKNIVFAVLHLFQNVAQNLKECERATKWTIAKYFLLTWGLILIFSRYWCLVSLREIQSNLGLTDYFGRNSFFDRQWK